MIPELCLSKIPRSGDVGKFVSMKGTIIRTGMVKMLETTKYYFCAKCQQNFPVQCDVEQYNMIPKPFECLATEGCQGAKFTDIPKEAGVFLYI